MKRIILFLLSFLIVSFLCAQSHVVSGKVVDFDNGNPLSGVSVLEQDTQNGVISDIDGQFSILVHDGACLEISHVGFLPMTIKTGDKEDIGIVRMCFYSTLLTDVNVVSQLVVQRETPIAMTPVPADIIENRLGSQEFPELLNHTPSVHANKQGGGWGDAEVYMRGFDNSNVAVMINGIPMNDMENGTVYWSNWTCLSDITAELQSQRGIGACKLSTPSIGGTINIVTKGIDVGKSGSVSYAIGGEGYNKLSFSYNSGINDKGWAINILGSKTWGEGYIQGLSFDAQNFFLNLTKRVNANHQISFMAYTSPQKHYKRLNALTVDEWNKVKHMYAINGKHWSCYNPEYGFDKNGQRKSNEYEEYNAPFLSFNHVWELTETSNLSTSVFSVFGSGISNSGMANNEVYSEEDWYGANYGVLNMKFRNSDGTFNYGAIEEINKHSINGSQMVMTNLVTRNVNCGMVSTFKDKLSDCFDFYAGFDARYYKGIHTNRISDLFGGEYYLDPERATVSVENNSNATSQWINQKLGVGDVIHRDYDGNVLQGGAFFQLDFQKNRLNSFFSGALNRTGYWRFDRFYYDDAHAKSDTKGFWGGTIKGGVNYKLSKTSNLYANAGYVSCPPKFKSGTFMSANTSNIINQDAKNEKALLAEIGYGFKNDYLKILFDGYYTEWIDKAMAKKGKMSNGKQYYMNMTGVNARHYGIELEFDITPIQWFDLKGMLSIGDWRWSSDNVKGLAYDIYGQAITPTGEITSPGSDEQAWAIINMKNINVGGSAQTTASIETEFNPTSNVKIGCSYNIFDRNFAYYSLSGSNLSLGHEMYVSEPWKMPFSQFVDLYASYSFNVGKSTFVISGLVNNLFNSIYIEKAWNPYNVGTEIIDVNYNEVYMFYSYGRTWNLKLRIVF